MMNDEISQSRPESLCRQVKDLLYLYSCAELSPGEMSPVEAHLRECPSCTVALEEHKKLGQVLRGSFSIRTLYYYSKDN